MQRQSLGSPSSKLVKDEQLIVCESQKQLPSPSTISTTISGLLYTEKCKEEEEAEPKKMMRLKPKASNSMPESYIHLIPMLTLLCFLILYLSSHDPSQNDLAEFNGLKTFSNPADLEENISELQRIVEKGDMLAIRSLKNFKEAAAAGTAKHRRLHRKIADF